MNGTAASIITFKCDESIKWDPNGTRVVTDYVISAAKLPVDPCFVSFSMCVCVCGGGGGGLTVCVCV